VVALLFGRSDMPLRTVVMVMPTELLRLLVIVVSLCKMMIYVLKIGSSNLPLLVPYLVRIDMYY
jgi:hypothetical protein